MYNWIEGDLNLSLIKRSDFNLYGIYLRWGPTPRLVISKRSVVYPDPEPVRLGSASFWDVDWDQHSGHADPDPADPDRYQFQTHVFFWLHHFLHFRWMQQAHPAATYHFTSPLSQVCRGSVGHLSSQWTVPLTIHVPGHVGVVGLLLSRSTELLKVTFAHLTIRGPKA